VQLHVRSNGTTGNGYVYRIFDTTTYTIQTGDVLEFDVWMDAANPQFIGGFDATVNGLTVRDNTGWLDQNGRHIHPGVNLATVASGQWYHRVFDMSSKVGQVLSNFKIVHQGNAAGTYVIKLKDVKVTNNGVVKQVIYQAGQAVQSI